MITYRDIFQVTKSSQCSKRFIRKIVGWCRRWALQKILLIGLHALQQVGVDVVCLDSAHGHSKGVIDALKTLKKNFKNLQVIAGNIGTAAGAKALADAGADAVKVGIGPGSICTTRIVAGAGVPQITAIMEVASALKNKSIPVIADGGIRYTGDMVKALAAGADCCNDGKCFCRHRRKPRRNNYL